MATYMRRSSGGVTLDSDDEEESLLGGRREKVIRISRFTTGAIVLLIGAYGGWLFTAHIVPAETVFAPPPPPPLRRRLERSPPPPPLASPPPWRRPEPPTRRPPPRQRRPPLPPGVAPLPGFVVAGVGHLAGNEPGGAPQPGNVTVAECAGTCRRWGWSCFGFSYFARPSWSTVSECYVKKVCTLGRVHTLAGALTTLFFETAHFAGARRVLLF